MSEAQVSFVQFDQPPLQPGTYTIEATHTVAGHPPVSARRRVTVTGPRFSLPGGSIAGVFPPDTARGAFAGVLPHAVLANCTLPWQRSTAAVGADAPLGTPWLAVLTLAAGELHEAPKPMQVRDLTPERAGAILTGWNALELGESLDDPCTVLDLDLRQFQDIAPTLEDLALLAHIRKVTTHDSEEASFFLPYRRHL